jgi:hypothetical protein
MPFRITRGEKAALALEAFDFEGGTGLKDKDDFIGRGVLDCTRILTGEALRGTLATGGVELPVQLADVKGKLGAGTLVVKLRIVLFGSDEEPAAAAVPPAVASPHTSSAPSAAGTAAPAAGAGVGTSPSPTRPGASGGGGATARSPSARSGSLIRFALPAEGAP